MKKAIKTIVNVMSAIFVGGLVLFIITLYAKIFIGAVNKYGLASTLYEIGEKGVISVLVVCGFIGFAIVVGYVNDEF